MTNEPTIEYQLKVADDPEADEPTWTTVMSFNDPRIAAREFYRADRSRRPAVHAVAGETDVVMGFTCPSGKWAYRNIVCNVRQGVRIREFEVGYFDALEQEAGERLAELSTQVSVGYDSRLHQDVEEFCKYLSEDGVNRRSRLIGKWIQAGQFDELSVEDRDAFAQLWAVNDVFDLEDEQASKQRKEAAQAMVENVRLCAPYGEALKNNRPLCASLEELTGFDLDAAVRTHIQSWTIYLPTVVRRVDEIAPLTEEDAGIFEQHIKPMGESHCDMATMERWQRHRRREDWVFPPASSLALDHEADEEQREHNWVREEQTDEIPKSMLAARIARSREEAVRRDPNASDEDVEVAKGRRKYAEFVASVLNVNEVADAAAPAAARVDQSMGGRVRGMSDARRAVAPYSSVSVPVRAIDWWTTQREVLRVSGNTGAELDENLRRLGPRPPIDQTWWFQDGRPCPAPPTGTVFDGRSTEVGGSRTASINADLEASREANRRAESTMRDDYLEGNWVSEGGDELHEPILRRYVSTDESRRTQATSSSSATGNKPRSMKR